MGCHRVLEIGPGMGALTTYLLEKPENEVWVMDIDRDSIPYLQEHFPALGEATLCGVIVDCNIETGLANNIESYISGGQLSKT